MRATLRILVLVATFAVIVLGTIVTATPINDRHFRKQSAITACTDDLRAAITSELHSEETPAGPGSMTAAIRFSHVTGRTTGLSEDGTIALHRRGMSSSGILATWEFSGYVDVAGKLRFSMSNHNIFSCNAVVFTDHSVATYGVQVTAWQPGDVVG